MIYMNMMSTNIPTIVITGPTASGKTKLSLEFAKNNNELALFIWIIKSANSNFQKYHFTELINTFRINNWLAFNLSPKYFFSGVESFGGIGVSSYINLLDNLQLIPEINTAFKKGSEFSKQYVKFNFLAVKTMVIKITM